MLNNFPFLHIFADITASYTSVMVYGSISYFVASCNPSFNIFLWSGISWQQTLRWPTRTMDWSELTYPDNHDCGISRMAIPLSKRVKRWFGNKECRYGKTDYSNTRTNFNFSLWNMDQSIEKITTSFITFLETLTVSVNWLIRVSESFF